MSLMIRWCSRMTVVTAAALLPLGAQGQMKDLNPKAVEIAQLPTFCWTQMGVPNISGPEFNFPRACGPGMNHYCPGLVHLIRAKKVFKKGDKARELLDADGMVRYTENAIRPFPTCPVRQHVEATRTEIRSLMTMYNVQRPKRTEQ